MKNSWLDAPLRVFLDVNYISSFGKPLLPKEDILLIADRVAACKPFFVNLGEDILNYEHLEELLARFSTASIKLSLSSSNLLDGSENLEYLKDHKIDFLEFKLDPHVDALLDDITYIDKIKETLSLYSGITKKVCPSMIVTGKNFKLIPYLMDFCIENSIKYFKMPNTVINERTISIIPDEHLLFEDVQKLRALLSEKADYYKKNLELFIHDLFIFEIFFPSKDESKMRAEYNGCQAGNALCYIDQNGDLYLCSSLYVSIGSVLENEIKTLFKSEKRAEYKKMIDEQYTDKCIECVDFQECKGGCRGIVYFVNDSFLGLDPLCPYGKQKH